MSILRTVLISSLFGAGLTLAADRPNILWITSEDNGPYLACYGDENAHTPNIDHLARQGVRYLNAFANAAVCAPARQTLISGMYATSIGGQHMRSKAVFPKGVPFFPKHLRDAGYYTSNNSKTDYNGGPADAKGAMKAAWDESSNKAHWRKRPKGTPFFSVFNITDSHESRLFPSRWKNREIKRDLSKLRLPGYLPDLPEIRLDLARYYECVRAMDEKVGRILEELKEDGLQDHTMVFYFADHGGSMPRGKSFIYDSGTRVPLIVRIPEKWKTWRPAEPGAKSDRLVSFVDFGATVLSLAGLDAPAYMQGRAFLGMYATEPREFVHTFRGRRGERYDIVRGVRSEKFLYLRNYTPHLPVMQYNGYAFGIPGYSAWQAAYERGDCAPEQARWFEPKTGEELYRVADDPDNVKNLAGDPSFRKTLDAMRQENDRHIAAIRDSVFFPEGMTGRAYPAYQHDKRYPLKQLTALANAVSDRQPANLPLFKKALRDENACLRYWGVMGCLVLGNNASSAVEELTVRLEDPEPVIQLLAARALAGLGQTAESLPVIKRYLRQNDSVLTLYAALAIDECGLLDKDPSLKKILDKARTPYADRVTRKLLGGK